MLKSQVVPEAIIETPDSPGLISEEGTSTRYMVVLDSLIRTFPTNGILTVFSDSGKLIGITEEIALSMSKSLRKSIPFWDMIADMKDWVGEG